MRRPKNFYNLTRPKIRASWNKYNLFNIARGAGREATVRGTPTFFQQKWAAKSKTRAYHGEHLAEKKWKRLFSPKFHSAVDMPPEYLAANDGSEQATGRGQGLSTSSINASTFSQVPGFSTSKKQLRVTRLSQAFGDVNGLLAQTNPHMTPHMQMVYAPLERRLDTAVFRAMFASSVRQARQFVVHGAVKVNGKKMIHPAYLLNPGDMFQVEVEKVLYATGAPKNPKEATEEATRVEREKKREEKRKEAAAKKATGAKPSDGEIDGAVAASEAGEGEGEGEGEDSAKPASEALHPEDAWHENNRALKNMLKKVKGVLNVDSRNLTAKEKKQLRSFRDSAKRFLSHPEKAEVDVESLIQDLAMQMKNHEMLRESFQTFGIKEEVEGEGESSASLLSPEAEAEAAEKRAKNRTRTFRKAFADLTEEQKEKAISIIGETQLTREEMRNLGRLLKSDEENPIDESKPYATPWRPRPFLAPFAFIPRYLEVNPNICAAIYLRHPVARKGMAEVPTPFGYLTNQLTHNWYVERG